LQNEAKNLNDIKGALDDEALVATMRNETIMEFEHSGLRPSAGNAVIYCQHTDLSHGRDQVYGIGDHSLPLK
jgi:hypothetical protein